MANGNLLVNVGTAQALLIDTAGTVDIGVVKIDTSALGTYGSIWSGQVSVGTTVNLPGGTLNNLASGTINAATVSSLPNIPGGTITNLVSGTINAATAILNSGTISVLPNLPGGTLSNLASGTINAATAILNSGTISVLPNLPGGSVVVTVGTVVQTVSSNLKAQIQGFTAAGALNSSNPLIFAGTDSGGTIIVPTVNNTTKSLLTEMNAGTLTALQNGTVQINPLPVTNAILHAGTAATTTIGTLVAAAAVGVGTALYVTHYSILAISGTPEVCLSFGSVVNGNQVVAHGLFPAGGGIVESVDYPHGYGTTNSPLTFQIISGSGTVAWDVNYFVHT